MDSRIAAKKEPQPELVAGRFEILAPLGTGLVGAVYRARDTQDRNDKDGSVALKVLRPGQDPSLIKIEALTLQTLWLEEEKLKDGLHTAPRLIMADPKVSRPFLAMEFIRGKQIPELLHESEARHFDEPIALNAAMQLFRLLSIVHEGLNKTYIDLKMENLWWQAENGGRLRVTDWNVLEERHPIAAGKTDPVLVDIFRASVSLYWMLTGELPDLQSNLKVRKLQRALNWDELSDGAKNLLSRLFSHKFKTAMQARRELERLLQYWKMDTASLVSMAREFVSNDVDKASEIVSILRKRNTQPDKDFGDLERALKETRSQRDDPSRSVALFKAGSYSAALALIDNAYPHTSQPHVFHWWRQAVELTSKAEYAIKKSMPDSNPDEKVEHIREIVVKSVNAYFNKQYADAEQYFSKLSYDLPDEQEIKRIYEELLDVLRILRLYAQAESQRELGSDEDAKPQRDLYKAAMENYEQARRKALTVSPDLLSEALSPTTLKDSIYELLNKTKVPGKAAKGKQYFKKGQIQSALDVWRDGFRLDPDYPELMDFVLSAASESVDNRKLDNASMLLDIIPMSGYSFACTALRKKIYDARQKQVEHNELASDSEAISEEQMPLEIPKDKEADGDMVLARSAKSLDLAQGQEKTGFANVKAPNGIVPVKKVRTKSKTSRHGKSVSRVSTTQTNNSRSVSKPTEKNQISYFIQPVPPLSSRERQDKLIAIGNEMANDERNRNLTIERLGGYVREVEKILRGVDQNDFNDFKEDRKRLAENQKRLQDAKKLFEEAQAACLENREAIVDKMKAMGFVGKKDRFENELGLEVLEEVKKATTLNVFSLQSLERLHSQYQENPLFANYINSQMGNFKKRVVEKTLHDDTFRYPDLLKALKDSWPDDPDISQAFDKLKALQEIPSGWKGIEYYQKLAQLNPMQCRRELDKYKGIPFVRLNWDEEVQEIYKQIDELYQKGLSLTLSQAYSLGPVEDYEAKMQKVISDYKLNLQLDDCVEWFKELKYLRG